MIRERARSTLLPTRITAFSLVHDSCHRYFSTSSANWKLSRSMIEYTRTKACGSYVVKQFSTCKTERFSRLRYKLIKLTRRSFKYKLELGICNGCVNRCSNIRGSFIRLSEARRHESIIIAGTTGRPLLSATRLVIRCGRDWKITSPPKSQLRFLR